jgi:protein-S-isoprenylcysteine O-methyltransferase Ste14
MEKTRLTVLFYNRQRADSIKNLIDTNQFEEVMMSEKPKILTPRVLIMLLVFVLGVPLLPLLISWRWNWWEAWVYAAICIFGFVISRYLAGRRHPDLLVERGKFLQNPNPEAWDKLLSPMLALGSGIIPLAAGLDMRFGLSAQFGFTIKAIAIILMLAGYTLGSYALIANRFFSGMVRIQSERGHHVISSGPYRWMRHPGYAGALISYLATPFLLDSWWTLIPVAFTLAAIFIRTRLEDRALQEKLEGYQAYAQKVRYRLIPGVW